MEGLSAINALLPAWYKDNARRLPWREDTIPYHVWLSEIMLQQTRVEAVIGYYRRFLDEAPDIKSLAALDEERLLKLWEGLGYYSRARNLQKAARVIVNEYGGVFPSDHAAIRKLPGVGPYTAGAIGSICFSLPTPAVDGNVLRVYARLRADGDLSDTDAFRKKVIADLTPVYEAGSPGLLTQALMELGACVCLPKTKPKCGDCPLSGVCLAHKNGEETKYPVKKEKAKRKIVYKIVLAADCGGKFPVRKRPSSGMLAGLWEFPNADVGSEADFSPSAAMDLAAGLGLHPTELLRTADYTHVFTHAEWRMRCYYLKCGGDTSGMTSATKARLRRDFALPSAMRPFFEELPEEEDLCE